MNLSFGIYDFFVGIIPGALYLAVGMYVTLRFGWVDADDLAGLNPAVVLVVSAVAAYLVGQLVAPTLMAITDRLPWWRTTDDDARADFLRGNPMYAGRTFLEANVHTLYAGVHMASPSLAERVDRSRATGIMLRSVVPVALIAAVVALVETVLGAYLLGPGTVVLCLGLALLALKEGRKFGLWSRKATFQAAVFVPDIDRYFAPPDEAAGGAEPEHGAARPTAEVS